ncbi:MAG: hypothetical protein GC166_07980 [Alphaproteobacteria bacterium]|nr:hypothetical protein [Alphaproteobacteria bacterium]
MFGGVQPDHGLVLFASLVICIALCVVAKPLGAKLGVLAYPGGRRRHAEPTPQVGGIAMIVPLVIWCAGALFADAGRDENLLFAIALCGAGVALIGFADDQKETSPLSRTLSLLVFLTAAFAFEPQFTSHTLNWGSLGPYPVPMWFYYPLMAVTAVGLVNAVNMADGQNGVVGSMYAIWALCLALTTTGAAAGVAWVLFCCALVFLAFNLRGRLFMGDAGTYGVTFVFGLLVTLAHAKGQVSLETIIVWFFIPVADCMRLVISRPMRGESPFDGDRDHFHHRLEDKMGKHMGLLSYASAVGLSSVISATMPRFALVCLVVLTAFYFSFAFLTDSQAERAAKSDGDAEAPQNGGDKIVSIVGDGGSDRRRRGKG